MSIADAVPHVPNGHSDLRVVASIGSWTHEWPQSDVCLLVNLVVEALRNLLQWYSLSLLHFLAWIGPQTTRTGILGEGMYTYIAYVVLPFFYPWGIHGCIFGT